ncbi:hypothetical protein D3C86_1108050 [compost metagenome]
MSGGRPGRVVDVAIELEHLVAVVIGEEEGRAVEAELARPVDHGREVLELHPGRAVDVEPVIGRPGAVDGDPDVAVAGLDPDVVRLDEFGSVGRVEEGREAQVLVHLDDGAVVMMGDVEAVLEGTVGVVEGDADRVPDVGLLAVLDHAPGAQISDLDAAMPRPGRVRTQRVALLEVELVARDVDIGDVADRQVRVDLAGGREAGDSPQRRVIHVEVLGGITVEVASIRKPVRKEGEGLVGMADLEDPAGLGQHEDPLVIDVDPHGRAEARREQTRVALRVHLVDLVADVVRTVDVTRRIGIQAPRGRKAREGRDQPAQRILAVDRVSPVVADVEVVLAVEGHRPGLAQAREGRGGNPGRQVDPEHVVGVGIGDVEGTIRSEGKPSRLVKGHAGKRQARGGLGEAHGGR